MFTLETTATLSGTNSGWLMYGVNFFNCASVMESGTNSISFPMKNGSANSILAEFQLGGLQNDEDIFCLSFQLII